MRYIVLHLTDSFVQPDLRKEVIFRKIQITQALATLWGEYNVYKHSKVTTDETVTYRILLFCCIAFFQKKKYMVCKNKIV